MKKPILYILLLLLVLTSCGPAPTLVPTISPTPTLTIAQTREKNLVDLGYILSSAERPCVSIEQLIPPFLQRGFEGPGPCKFFKNEEIKSVAAIWSEINLFSVRFELSGRSSDNVALKTILTSYPQEIQDWIPFAMDFLAADSLSLAQLENSQIVSMQKEFNSGHFAWVELDTILDSLGGPAYTLAKGTLICGIVIAPPGLRR